MIRESLSSKYVRLCIQLFTQYHTNCSMSPITRLKVTPVFKKGCEAILVHTPGTLETKNNMKNSLCKL